jgi:hypothetical protein
MLPVVPAFALPVVPPVVPTALAFMLPFAFVLLAFELFALPSPPPHAADAPSTAQRERTVRVLRIGVPPVCQTVFG